jgi:hypothetical protein
MHSRLRCFNVPLMNIDGRLISVASIVSFNTRIALLLTLGQYCRCCVRRLKFGNIRVLLLHVVVFVAGAVVLLMHPVAMADLSREGKRENTDGVGIWDWPPLFPTAASLYLRGELPW